MINQLSIVELKPPAATTAIVKPINPVEFSTKEVSMAGYMCTDLSYKEIADLTGLSIRTVQFYRNILCEKMDVKSRVGIAVYAIKFGVVQV